MPASRHVPWLVCYDISDPKRLARVHRTVSKDAVPLQYSVYFTIATRRTVASFLDRVAKQIDPARDDLRAYPLLTAGRHEVYGSARLAEDVHLVSDLGSLTRQSRHLTTSDSRSGGSIRVRHAY